MGIVINSCVTSMHGMYLYSYLLCMHTLSTSPFQVSLGKLTCLGVPYSTRLRSGLY